MLLFNVVAQITDITVAKASIVLRVHTFFVLSEVFVYLTLYQTVQFSATG